MLRGTVNESEREKQRVDGGISVCQSQSFLLSSLVFSNLFNPIFLCHSEIFQKMSTFKGNVET